MSMFFWGLLVGWLVFKQPEWVKNLFLKIKEKVNKGFLNF